MTQQRRRSPRVQNARGDEACDEDRDEGLAGDDIPFWARIFTIIDVWDAMRSDRPYRKAISEKKIFKYIREESSKLFDPRVVEAFFDLRSQKPQLLAA